MYVPAGADPAESTKHIIPITVTTEAALAALYAAEEAGADDRASLTWPCTLRAGDGNRTRTISLGS